MVSRPRALWLWYRQVHATSRVSYGSVLNFNYRLDVSAGPLIEIIGGAVIIDAHPCNAMNIVIQAEEEEVVANALFCPSRS